MAAYLAAALGSAVNDSGAIVGGVTLMVLATALAVLVMEPTGPGACPYRLMDRLGRSLRPNRLRTRSVEVRAGSRCSERGLAMSMDAGRSRCAGWWAPSWSSCSCPGSSASTRGRSPVGGRSSWRDETPDAVGARGGGRGRASPLVDLEELPMATGTPSGRWRACPAPRRRPPGQVCQAPRWWSSTSNPRPPSCDRPGPAQLEGDGEWAVIDDLEVRSTPADPPTSRGRA